MPTTFKRRGLVYEGQEKRKIVECITNKIVISKDEIEIDLCYLPSSKEMSKRDRSLQGPVPFCHLRLFFSRNGNLGTRFLLGRPLKPTIWNLFDIRVRSDR